VRKSRVAAAALVIAAVMTLSLAAVKAQGPGQGGQPPTPPPASPAAKPDAAAPSPSQSEGTKPEASEPAKPAESAPSVGAGTPAARSASDTPSATLASLLQEGFEVRATAFVPADAVTRQSGKSSSDAILVTLQKAAVSAVCFYTLKAYVSKKLGTIPACTVHR
jgi:outer membrane biosynthesis protein TonB